MREIEFRGFSFGDGPDLVRIAGPDGSARFRWGRWLTGSLVLWADRDASLLRSDPDDDRDHLSQYFVLPETVGEWTGYYDSHSRRIYEGDLVRFERAIYRVELWQGCWCLRPLCGGRPALVSKVYPDLTLVGTVYDPEVTGDDRA